MTWTLAFELLAPSSFSFWLCFMLQLSGVPSRCSTLLKFKNLNSTPKPKMKWNSKARKTQPAAQVLATRRSQVQAALGSCDGVVLEATGWDTSKQWATQRSPDVAMQHGVKNAQAVKPPFGSIWQVANIFSGDVNIKTQVQSWTINNTHTPIKFIKFCSLSHAPLRSNSHAFGRCTAIPPFWSYGSCPSKGSSRCFYILTFTLDLQVSRCAHESATPRWSL